MLVFSALSIRNPSIVLRQWSFRALERNSRFQVGGELCQLQPGDNGQWDQFKFYGVVVESLDLPEEQPLKEVVSMKLVWGRHFYIVPGKGEVSQKAANHFRKSLHFFR